MSEDQKIMQQDDLNQEFIKAVQDGSKIDAIKHYRNKKNIGFREAQRYVEANWDKLRIYCNLPRDTSGDWFEDHDHAGVVPSSSKGLSGLTNTLNEMKTNPELAEVNDMLDDKLKKMRRPELKIVVWYEYPPIPDRQFDYIAMYEHDDGDSGRWGNGSTPFMAIKDLIDNINPTEEWKKLHGK